MIKHQRFWALLTVVTMAAVAATGAGEPAEPGDAASFIGVWHVTSAQSSILFNIQPGGKALFLLIQDGSHGIDPVTWRPLPGGVLIEGMPRFRLWKGRGPDDIRVEMEPISPELAASSVQAFPQAFFMRRVKEREFSDSMIARPLPKGWADATLPAGWDETAGKRRAAE